MRATDTPTAVGGGIPPRRFYSLDALRGVAALSVVFWHWQHFFYDGVVPGQFDAQRLPFSTVASILYAKGSLAVDLFFSLSGFVFFWLYSRPVGERRMPARRFALLRFSRLYPLHLATLLLVAAGQLWFRSANGSFFVYPANDGYHFALNLAFISAWGMQRDFSFNGPVWSVSIETLLYMLFFLFCRYLPVRARYLALISAAGFVIQWTYNAEVGRGLFSFFLGGLVLLVYRRIASSALAARLSRNIIIFTILVWAGTILAYQLGWTLDAGMAQEWTSVPLLRRMLDVMLRTVHYLWPVAVLFPLAILSLALAETQRGTLGRRLAFLGDMSYSCYLLHFPLQLLSVIGAGALGLGASLFYSPWFMLLFFGLLMALGLSSYRLFELPLQESLRGIDDRARAARHGVQSLP